MSKRVKNNDPKKAGRTTPETRRLRRIRARPCRGFALDEDFILRWVGTPGCLPTYAARIRAGGLAGSTSAVSNISRPRKRVVYTACVPVCRSSKLHIFLV